MQIPERLRHLLERDIKLDGAIKLALLLLGMMVVLLVIKINTAGDIQG
jgi:hypothetical protein